MKQGVQKLQKFRSSDNSSASMQAEVLSELPNSYELL